MLCHLWFLLQNSLFFGCVVIFFKFRGNWNHQCSCLRTTDRSQIFLNPSTISSFLILIIISVWNLSYLIKSHCTFIFHWNILNRIKWNHLKSCLGKVSFLD
jgi:hypothetical protein